MWNTKQMGALVASPRRHRPTIARLHPALSAPLETPQTHTHTHASTRAMHTGPQCRSATHMHLEHELADHGNESGVSLNLRHELQLQCAVVDVQLEHLPLGAVGVWRGRVSGQCRQVKRRAGASASSSLPGATQWAQQTYCAAQETGRLSRAPARQCADVVGAQDPLCRLGRPWATCCTPDHACSGYQPPPHCCPTLSPPYNIPSHPIPPHRPGGAPHSLPAATARAGC